MYIFDRHCACIFYIDWHRHRKSGSVGVTTSTTSATASMNGHPEEFVSPSASTVTPSTTGHNITSHHSTTSQLTNTSLFSDSRLINLDEEAKLVYGVVFSLRNFVRKLSGSQDGFLSYRTSHYKLHYYETPTGLKFVINTDPAVDKLRPVLRQIYTNFYVEYVVKNPLSPAEHPSGEGVNNEYFRAAVDKFVKSLPVFES
ncbi:2162_t:CDS:2 [Ambispora leptoticha]|uniref:Trafficking protein particle complex subunit n=1 Tax=Ambispora leptoticha TaxID=144679 RepID=A0A9N8V2E2_9GLOM|nr:2162_t:CDS:2 [Ambispora leptoticha]